MYAGVVFDFDGVLFDSEKHWDKTENLFLRDHINDWNPEEYKLLIGKSLHEAFLYLESRGLDLNEPEYITAYEKMAEDLYSVTTKPLPNLELLLHQLSVRGKKVAIASSSKRAWIDSALSANRLPITFNAIITIDDPSIIRGKPAPDIYLQAARVLGEDPAQLLAVEDSKNGVASARAAGLYCFGLKNGFNDSQDLSNSNETIYGYEYNSIARIMDLLI